jgi:DNA-binding transcriptional ArsR family regulator
VSRYRALWQTLLVHLLPPDRRQRRILDGERVCRAIEVIGDPSDHALWASRFALLGDATRLMLLLAIAEAGPISVTDLATATGITDTNVSQCLRLLRAAGTVVGNRDGRIIRYELADRAIQDVLPRLGQPHPRRRHAVS